MSEDCDVDERMATVARRVEYLELLDREGPLATRDVVGAVADSRSTVTRALRCLREADLVEKCDGGYRATLAGAMAADEYRRYERTCRAVLTSTDLLRAVPDDDAPPVSVLTRARVDLAGEGCPVAPLEAVAERVHRADAVRAYLPTLINTHLVRGWHRPVVEDGVAAEVAVDPDLLAAMRSQFPAVLAGLAGGVSVFSATGPPYGLFLTTRAGATTLSLVVYEDDTAVRGVLANDAPGAVEWGRKRLDAVLDDATAVTDDLADAGGPAGTWPDDRGSVGSDPPRSADGNSPGSGDAGPTGRLPGRGPRRR